MTNDRELLDAWWAAFARTGEVPPALRVVQSRLIRSVHRGALPSGEVFIKTMTFPRAKDRLRYAFRALPAQHEAAMLRATRAAGIPCPEVVEVRTRRRFGLPYRSWLVLRALPTPEAEPRGGPQSEAVASRLRDEATVALALLEAGIVHRDLHGENFVRLADGRLAILDLQSTRRPGAPATDRDHRLAAAARLVRDQEDWQQDRHGIAAALRASGLVVDDEELAMVRLRAMQERSEHLRRRVMRCLGETTEFTRRIRWNGIEYQSRDSRPPGRWIGGRSELRQSWLGQRALFLFGSRSPLFWAFFQKWWWLGGGCALYVPQACTEDRIDLELATAREGVAMLAERAAPGGVQDGASRQRTESSRRGE